MYQAKLPQGPLAQLHVKVGQAGTFAWPGEGNDTCPYPVCGSEVGL